ncbi:hypothetical protein [Pseudomonas fluorescens]|nr:hypothetical protein [Pseudomonas fluorescens]
MTINKKITAKPNWSANGMVIKTTKNEQPSLRKLEPRTCNSGHPMPGIYPDLQLLGTALQQGRAGRSVIGGVAEQVEYQQLKQTCERRGMQEGDYRLFPPMRDEHSQYLPPQKKQASFGFAAHHRQYDADGTAFPGHRCDGLPKQPKSEGPRTTSRKMKTQ